MRHALAARLVAQHGLRTSAREQLGGAATQIPRPSCTPSCTSPTDAAPRRARRAAPAGPRLLDQSTANSAAGSACASSPGRRSCRRTMPGPYRLQHRPLEAAPRLRHAGAAPDPAGRPRRGPRPACSSPATTTTRRLDEGDPRQWRDPPARRQPAPEPPGPPQAAASGCRPGPARRAQASPLDREAGGLAQECRPGRRSGSRAAWRPRRGGRHSRRAPSRPRRSTRVRLALLLVLAGALAHGLRGGLPVEDVVGDLEGGAERPAVGARGAARAGGSARPRMAPASTEKARIAPVFIAWSRRIAGLVQARLAVAALRREVEHLAADHAAEPRGAGEAEHEVGPDGAVRIGRGIGQHLEGEGLERVAGEDGGRLVEGLVHGRPAPAQVVVVHGGQVVMDEGIAVQELERAPRPASAPVAVAAEQAGGLDASGTAAGACRRRAPRGAWRP